jgi:hypothetical protein
LVQVEEAAQGTLHLRRVVEVEVQADTQRSLIFRSLFLFLVSLAREALAEHRMGLMAATEQLVGSTEVALRPLVLEQTLVVVGHLFRQVVLVPLLQVRLGLQRQRVLVAGLVVSQAH